MGLALRYNLFHDVDAIEVLNSVKAFYSPRGFQIAQSGLERRRFDLHATRDEWAILSLDGGWEWKIRREAQLFVSKRLGCTGFLVFVYDGDYWGYEFFDKGQVLDHFVQDPEGGEYWFPHDDCKGNAALVASRLPHVRAEEIQPYLTQRPPRNIKARPSDEFHMRSECAVLDFMRTLGASLSLIDGYVAPDAPVVQSYWIDRLKK